MTRTMEDQLGEPWEITFLKAYCSSEISLEHLGYARKSVLAAAWYVTSHTSVTHPDVCLCGERLSEQCLVRQWVEYYTSHIRTETQWDALSREELHTVLEELNSHLSTRVFIVGTRLSLADIILYYGLHRYMVGMAFNQKSNCICSKAESQWRDKRVRLKQLLSNRCASAHSSSRESNRYTTLSDAVEKLNLLVALQDEECFPFICKVVTLLYEQCYWVLSSSTQTTLLKICEVAKNICIERRQHIQPVLRMISRATATLETVSAGGQLRPYHVVRSSEVHLKSLGGIRTHLEEAMEQLCGQSDLCQLHDDCLRLIVSYLSHPIDIINLGLTNHKLHLLTEEGWVWRGLITYHFGRNKVEHVQTTWEDSEIIEWKEFFITQYQASKEKFRVKEKHSVLYLCKSCNTVFWKEYGHPCSMDTDIELAYHDVKPEEFLSLFVC